MADRPSGRLNIFGRPFGEAFDEGTILQLLAQRGGAAQAATQRRLGTFARTRGLPPGQEAKLFQEAEAQRNRGLFSAALQARLAKQQAISSEQKIDEARVLQQEEARRAEEQQRRGGIAQLVGGVAGGVTGVLGRLISQSGGRGRLDELISFLGGRSLLPGQGPATGLPPAPLPALPPAVPPSPTRRGAQAAGTAGAPVAAATAPPPVTFSDADLQSIISSAPAGAGGVELGIAGGQGGAISPEILQALRLLLSGQLGQVQ